MGNENKGEKMPELQIFCKCGCNLFEQVKAHRLSPGDESGPNITPAVRIWRCAACGTIHLPQNMPKKNDQPSQQPGSANKLLLPENHGKIKVVN